MDTLEPANFIVFSALRGKITLSQSLALFGMSFKRGSTVSICLTVKKIPCVMFVYYIHVRA